MSVIYDLRYAVRSLSKTPGFTVIAVLTLALGIAGNTVIFSAVKTSLFEMAPVEKPRQLARLWAANPAAGEDRAWPSLPDFLDWKEQSASFAGMAAVRYADFRVRASNGETVRVNARLVTAGYLSMLHVAHLPAGLWFPFRAPDSGKELLLPMAVDRALIKRAARNTMVFARLRDGVSKQQAQAEMDAIAKRLERAHPDTNSGWGKSAVEVRRLRTDAGLAVYVLSTRQQR